MHELKPHIEGYRNFLEDMWFQTHREWNDIPPVLSRHMCRFSTLFLKSILKSKHNIDTEIISGRPSEHLNGTIYGEYGYQDVNGNRHDHSWLRVNEWIIDITADQFGEEPVIITTDLSLYYPSPDQSVFQADYISLSKRVDKWLQSYTLSLSSYC